MFTPNFKWLIRSLCLRLERKSQSLIIPEDLYRRISSNQTREENLALKKEIADLKEMYPLEPLLVKASTIINKINIPEENSLYWNVIELSKAGVVHGYHILTKEKVTEEKLSQILGEILSGEFKIKFMSRKDLNQRTQVEFDIPFSVPEYTHKHYIVGEKEYKSSFFEKNYPKSQASFVLYNR